MIDKNLKPITIEGEQYYYRIGYDCNEGYSWDWTEFYKTNDKVKLRQRFFLFGDKIEISDNRIAFRVEFDITSCGYTKEYVKEKILKIKNERKVLNERCEEIKSGNII